MNSRETGVRGQLKDFLDFIRSKGVIGLAVGLIIGLAVTDTVNALVDGLLNPLVSLVLPVNQLEQASFIVDGAAFRWGLLVSAVINLVIIAAVVYYGVKALGLEKLDKTEEQQ